MRPDAKIFCQPNILGVQLNYIPMVTNSLKLNPFTHRAARHV